MAKKRTSKRKRRVRFSIILFVLVLATVLSGYFIYDYLHCLLSPLSEEEVSPKLVRIPEGADAGEIAELLEEEGLIRSAWAFRLWAKLKRLDDNLQAGSYALSPSMSTQQIIAVISTGQVHTKGFTIPEGTRLMGIGEILEREGICTALEFERALKDVKLPAGLPAEANESLEGYLFPDTYLVSEETTAEEIVAMMVGRFLELWREELSDAAEDSGMSMHQIVTLASIIEKEALLDEERALVSAVFHNRLERGMRLESCATVLYAVDKTDERITIQDLKVDHPYNTYKYNKLPPGPICSPGLKSLIASVAPADVDYLFFISCGDGSHHFSKSYVEHEQLRLEKER